MIEFIVAVLWRGDGWRLHLGAGRLAARAYARRAGQLLGTQIPHAPAAASTVGALVIAMVRSPFRAATMA
jgi:hypothetical protein